MPVEVALVLAVARLGEVDLFGWWRARGLGEAGRYVLGEGLRRTWLLAALEGAVLSASAYHAEAFARRDALHLFSDELPAKGVALGWLRERKVEGEGDGLLTELRGWTRETCVDGLRRWAEIAPPAGELLGPLRRLGSVSRAELEEADRSAEIVRQLAAAYADDPAALRLPYFDLKV